MSENNTIFIGSGDKPQFLNLKYANRHGLIAGATGTGKTVTLQCLSEGFSKAGVPVFVADVKGDLSGISQAGKPHPKLDERAEKIGFADFDYEGFPTVFWDLFGEQGHPVRTTVSEMGPLLLSRILRLSETQEGVMNIAFTIADEYELALLDFKDLRAILQFVNEHRKKISGVYGNVSTASIGAIQRQLLTLDRQGGANFFGEPALKLTDLMRRNLDGQGLINVLAADQLVQSPRLYATFLLWLLSELFEELPEQGDADKPRLVFFFDEAHLLFDEAPKALLEKVEQVVRLIRSKGVGVYFVTQNPADVPEEILGQLGNRVQHALRAFTPRDQKAVRAAAQTFRANPSFDTEEAITQLGVGEALVSTLESKGVPSVVERTLIRPPSSRMGPVTEMERGEVVNMSPLFGVYEEIQDRESAYEKLAARAQKAEAMEQEQSRNDGRTQRYEQQYNTQFGRNSSRQVSSRDTVGDKSFGGGRGRGMAGDLFNSMLGGATGGRRRRSSSTGRRRSNRQSAGEAFTKSILRSVGSQMGRQLARGLLGGVMRRR